MEKLREVKRILRGTHGIIVAYSGGVDSALLAAVAHEVLGRRCLAVIATSPVHPRREHRAALAWLEEAGIPYEEVLFDALSLDAFRLNPPDRCYHCKRDLFRRMLTLARSRGFSHVADGSNADDRAEVRPGMRALEELGVLSPLLEAGLTKLEVRWLAAEVYGLPQAGLPSRACLASRIPYGRPITADEITAIERLEDFLAGRGFGVFRARHGGDTLRLELARDEWPAFLDPAVAEPFVALAKEQGFRFVSLDLEGYRTGSLNPPSPPGDFSAA